MSDKSNSTWFTWLTAFVIPVLALGLTIYQILKEESKPEQPPKIIVKEKINPVVKEDDKSKENSKIGEETKKDDKTRKEAMQKLGSLGLEALYSKGKFEEALEKLGELQSQYPLAYEKIQAARAGLYLQWGQYLYKGASKNFEKLRISSKQFDEMKEAACRKLEQCIANDTLKEYTQQTKALLKEWKK